MFVSYCKYYFFKHLYIPIWLYSNELKDFATNVLRFFTFQSGYIPIPNQITHRFARTLTLHSNLVIFQWFMRFWSKQRKILYIPIWLYSNPSTIIPHIYRLWKLLFVDLRFLIHPTAIFFASYSYYLCLDLYYSGFVYLPIFKVYHRLTIILVQLMFYINLI